MPENSLKPGETELTIRGTKHQVQIYYQMHPEDWNSDTALEVCQQVAEGVCPSLKMDNQVIAQNRILTYWSTKKVKDEKC